MDEIGIVKKKPQPTSTGAAANENPAIHVTFSVFIFTF
jgi:hypothetical protein